MGTLADSLPLSPYTKVGDVDTQGGMSGTEREGTYQKRQKTIALIEANFPTGLSGLRRSYILLKKYIKCTIATLIDRKKSVWREG